MSLFDDLQPGSYKGVPFLISTSSISGGRKDVLHSFPNSEKQTIEDLGLNPRVYNVTAFINANTKNENYLQKRDFFLSILEQSEPGTLIHPLYGRIDNVVARSFTLNENFTELGQGKISIVFGVTDDFGVPFRSQNTLSLIESSNNNYFAALNIDVAKNFNVNIKNLNSFQDSIETLNNVVTDFQKNTDFIQASSDKIDTYTKQLNDFSSNVTSLVSSPQNLADSINNLFIAVGNLYPSVDASVNVLTGFFDFNDNKTNRIENTTSRIERNKNDNIIKASMQNLSLSMAYLNTAQIKFDTVTDIQIRSDALETQFRKVISLSILENETQDKIHILRDAYQLFIDEQKLNARQLITVNTNLTSARLLSYQYYADSTQGERLADLNNIDDVTFIEGNVTILTA